MTDTNRERVLTATKLSPLYQSLLDQRYDVLDRLHQTDPAALAKLAPHIRAIAASGESKVDAALIDSLPALQLISVMGVGYDGVDVAAAKARGVMVTHTPDVLNDDVADLAIGLMLSAARQLPAADRHVRSGEWEAKGPMPLARKMSGARLGLVGMGRIGQAIAHRALAFGMSIAYTARSQRPQLPYAFHADAVSLARESDFLVLITPGGAGTRKMINAEVLAALGSKGHPGQRGARLGCRRSGLDRCLGAWRDRRRRPGCLRGRAEGARAAARPATGGAGAAHRQRHRTDPAGDGRSGVCQPRRALRRQAAVDAGARVPTDDVTRMTMSTFSKVILLTDSDGRARFREEAITLSEGKPQAMLSPLMASGGYQLRHSPVGFRSEFHCTVIPQWVFILEGQMEIGLQDGSSRVFGAGQHFYSADSLPDGADFDASIHGHWSRQVGSEPLVTLFVRD